MGGHLTPDKPPILPHPLPPPEQVVLVYRLIHALCEIGFDTGQWRERLLIELERLLDSKMTVSYVMHFSLDPANFAPKTLFYHERGANEVWRRYMAGGDLTTNPVTVPIMQRFGTNFTVARHEFVDDETYYASPFWRDVALPSEWDDAIFSQVAVKDPSVVDGLGITRPPGMRRFTIEDVNLVRFIHEELCRLWNRPDPIGIHTLPARQRETLYGIRRGESRKGIADKMGVSEHTVHGYEKSLFKRAGVGSRGELISTLAGVIRPNLLP